MNYANGATVRVGDRVDLGQRQIGHVVGIIQEGLYSPGYKRSDWDYLETGILIKTSFGDVRVESPDEDMELISRHEVELAVYG